MPELPEVETVRRGLAAVMAGRTLSRVEVRRGDLRRPLPADFAARLEGRAVVAIDRRAKYLLFRLDDGGVLLAHLGMSGRMVVSPRGANAPVEEARHEHIVFFTGDGARIGFSDPRRFGLMDLTTVAALEDHPLLRHLGPEPLDAAFDGAALGVRLAGKRTPIKAALLDQRVVAGLGNIYVCEALHVAGLSPRRSALTVQGLRADRLATAIHGVLDDAIAAGGSSLRDYVTATGGLGYFQFSWRVYGREGDPCRDEGCGGTVSRLVQSGRSTFYCSRCQR
ncbi:MAG: bifunctional DNA-formamidopyrimidine glycosylase/DNA-(apurinic or apyrimidinic site) lyase [Alphaproteobacteria bacterium]|nr:bifunctional DNA-formamidopyrimidine glycosylase/DNA-(apurinic or apyrimidinic site) lyase [Alphaproteobacteria bacterium]